MSKSLGQIAYDAQPDVPAPANRARLDYSLLDPFYRAEYERMGAAVRDAVLAEQAGDWQDECNPLSYSLSFAISHLRSLLSRRAAEVASLRLDAERYRWLLSQRDRLLAALKILTSDGVYAEREFPDTVKESRALIAEIEKENGK